MRGAGRPGRRGEPTVCQRGRRCGDARRHRRVARIDPQEGRRQRAAAGRFHCAALGSAPRRPGGGRSADCRRGERPCSHARGGHTAGDGVPRGERADGGAASEGGSRSTRTWPQRRDDADVRGEEWPRRSDQAAGCRGRGCQRAREYSWHHGADVGHRRAALRGSENPAGGRRRSRNHIGACRPAPELPGPAPERTERGAGAGAAPACGRRWTHVCRAARARALAGARCGTRAPARR